MVCVLMVTNHPVCYKSGSKEGGGKTSGGLDAGDMVGPMSPTPSTPGTPKSPLTPVATTPTKAGIPDSVKTGPGSV